MAERLTELQAIKLLKETAFHPLKVTIDDGDFVSPDGKSKNRTDLYLNLSWNKKSSKFIAEIIGEASPKTIDSAIFKIKKRLSLSKPLNKNFSGLIVAPYLNEETLNHLVDEQISGVDLSGNGAIIIPNKMLVYKSGAKNKFPSNAPIKNVYRGSSSLAARVLLSKPDYSSVTELVQEIKNRGGKLTFSTVSKVLKTLEEQLIVSKNEGIRLIDGKRLLALLRDNYRAPQITKTLVGKAADLTKAFKIIRDNSKRDNVSYAIDDPTKYVVMPSSGNVMEIYTESFEKIITGMDFTETNRFPNIAFVETTDPTIYFERFESDDLHYLSPLQIFLKLSNEGKREREMADEIGMGILDFKYKR